MASTRKTSTRKTSTAKKKKTGTTSQTGKASRGKRGNTAAVRAQDSALFHEIGLIVLFVVMVLLFCCNFGIIGPAGNAVSSVLFGLFGFPAYAVPILIFLAVAFWFANEGNPNAVRKLVSGIVLCLMLGILCDLIAKSAGSMESYSLKTLYGLCSTLKKGGGIFAGSISYFLQHYLGTIGAVLVMILCSVVSLILLTEKSLLNSMKEGGIRVRELSREDAQRRREHNRRRYEEQEEQRLKREEQRARKSELRAQKEEERRLKAEERETEKILRMEKKVSGVMMNIELSKQEERQDNIHEIQYTNDFQNVVNQDWAAAQANLVNQNRTVSSVTVPAAAAIPKPVSKPKSTAPVAEKAEPVSVSEPVPGRKMEPQPQTEKILQTTVSAMPEFDFDKIKIRTVHQVNLRSAEEAISYPASLEGQAVEEFEVKASYKEDAAAEETDSEKNIRNFLESQEEPEAFTELPKTGSDSLHNMESGLKADMLQSEAAETGDWKPEMWERKSMEEEVPENEDWEAEASEEEITKELSEAESWETGIREEEVSKTENWKADSPEEELSKTENRKSEIPEEALEKVPEIKNWEETSTEEEIPEELSEAENWKAGIQEEEFSEIENGEETSTEEETQEEFSEAENWKAGIREEEVPATQNWEDVSMQAETPQPEIKITEIEEPAQDIRIRKEGMEEPKTPKASEKARPAAKLAPEEHSVEPQIQKEVSQREKQLPKEYIFPPLSWLQKGEPVSGDSTRELKETAMRLQQTLSTFGVKVTITEISQGPSVTRYELQPEMGVKVSKIVGLTDDIKLNLAATDIRMEAPIPGKAAIGIEVPNKENMTVALRDLLESKEFKAFPSNLAFAVGKDIAGQVVVADIAKMPHVLIAGATGSGKSVCINTLIMSILYKARPDEVKLIMVDPKVVELSVYNGIPHLLIPVVTDPKKASAALHWGVSEMEDRYRKFADFQVRDLKGYNKKVEAMQESGAENVPEKLPQIVIIVDELADLMMVCPGEVEESICRLAQLARAAGIHLVIATQRPSVDVITGLIKANMPSRIAFSVSSGVDSRTILDMNGAEKLLGKGDMLFYPQGYAKPARVQGAFVSDKEVSDVVDFLKNETIGNVYAADIEEKIKSMGTGSGSLGSGGPDIDELFEKAGRFIIEKDKASIGMLQRVLKIGFNRAARIMDQLCEYGVVGEEEGTKPRKVLMGPEQFEELIEEQL